MASLNSVQIVGNLGGDPEIRYTQSGDCVVTLSVATTEKWRDKESGQMREHTEWHRISVFGKNAEYLKNYAKKGSEILVLGSLRTRKWQVNGEDRYGTSVHASDSPGSVQLLGNRNAASAARSGGSDQSERPQKPSGTVPGHGQAQGQRGRRQAPSDSQREPEGYLPPDIPF